jgi:hypothetical protein
MIRSIRRRASYANVVATVALFAAIATAAAVLAAAPAAHATVRFADPNGSLSGTCAPPDPPCTLERATNNVAVTGDEVIVAPGDYPVTNQLNIASGVEVHGATGLPRPRVASSAPLVGVNVSGALRAIEIELTGSGGYALNLNDGATAEELLVQSANSATCNFFLGGINATALLRDTVCWNTVTGAFACAVCLNQGGSGTRAATLRNVTAVATGLSSGVVAGASGDGVNTIEGQNVIASAPSTDVGADATSPAVAEVTLEYSNYETRNASGTGASITDPTTANNQTAAPLFTNSTTGDFHQLAGSPTIDAGSASASMLGTLDFDGEPRIAGPAPDIGADEFVDTSPPDTTITKRPKNKTRKRRARFEFTSTEPGSTFECKLDTKPYRPCSSPKRYARLKPGRHIFRVRAKDAADNVDATPATDSWRVKKN